MMNFPVVQTLLRCYSSEIVLIPIGNPSGRLGCAIKSSNSTTEFLPVISGPEANGNCHGTSGFLMYDSLVSCSYVTLESFLFNRDWGYSIQKGTAYLETPEEGPKVLHMTFFLDKEPSEKHAVVINKLLRHCLVSRFLDPSKLLIRPIVEKIDNS